MTKTIPFDFEIQNNLGIKTLTDRGAIFVLRQHKETLQEIYRLAIEAGLHVKFESASVRDLVA